MDEALHYFSQLSQRLDPDLLNSYYKITFDEGGCTQEGDSVRIENYILPDIVVPLLPFHSKSGPIVLPTMHAG